MAKKHIPQSIRELDTTREMQQLGARIRQLRKQLGYTSYESFANEHDMHRVQWGRYEQGQDLYFSTLVRVIKVLGVTVEEFFKEGFEIQEP